jgi:hypothetical protein
VATPSCKPSDGGVDDNDTSKDPVREVELGRESLCILRSTSQTVAQVEDDRAEGSYSTKKHKCSIIESGGFSNEIGSDRWCYAEG